MKSNNKMKAKNQMRYYVKVEIKLQNKPNNNDVICAFFLLVLKEGRIQELPPIHKYATEYVMYVRFKRKSPKRITPEGSHCTRRAHLQTPLCELSLKMTPCENHYF